MMVRYRFCKLPSLVVGGCLWLLLAAVIQADEPAPERVKDLRYGWVLYNYHQGQAFDALTQLAVAREKGGIEGHGDHPGLVEGGLMLSYGMTREAGRLFTSLLGEGGNGSSLSPEIRNQAWFYLGKVLYLEADYDGAYANLQRVDGRVLADSDLALYQEWLYLQCRLVMSSPAIGDPAALDGLRKKLGGQNIWSAYLDYNVAMAQISAGDSAAAGKTLRALIDHMTERAPVAEDVRLEHEGLLDRTRLSLARLYLDENHFDDALRVLEALPVDGPFSDRALFDYAVAAAGQGEVARAFNALETLSRKQLFTPWLQQVPYARGYLLEEMGRPGPALKAFRDAARHYQALDRELVAARQELTEKTLMSLLKFMRDGDGLMTDAYGRLRVIPEDFGIAGILAAESFQQALSELHQLYGMQSFLGDWQKQLGSFAVMLETRKLQRDIRIRETRAVLARQEADKWAAEHARLSVQVNEALAREDHEFFMTTEQKALKARLDQVAETLKELPDDGSTASQRAQFRRMQAYFDWWVADEYGVNRWAAQKQLRELGNAMSTFRDQRQIIESLMAEDRQHNLLSRRLAEKEAEVEALRGELSAALAEARGRLMGRMDAALAERRLQLQGYLRASRHAQARLADKLFQAGQQGAAND
ncbi:hypothetical protein BKP64_03695 [Marinobacter salinus]|uniref:Tetratricopeptide repeat protein n=2 Tax=Marinobacter salinus TaxID=1874317 RepID=A0A1D9GR81_9GAMM|nr:hypothetical protein BKP64_03695 [Marinobacter salinus]